MFEKLRAIRNSKGLTCEQMAKMLGLSNKSVYSKKERGRIRFYLEDAKKVSDILGCSIEDIFLTKMYL